MWTAKWWWETQWILARVNARATIAPLIIASDKTSLSTLSGGQEAYPVYLTIGNISKTLRRKAKERATVLIGYLPVDKFEDVKNPEVRARLRADMTHRAMEQLFAPLKTASEEGFEAWCADGRLRHVYPIVAAFVGDWPEQNLMACTNGGGCPICETPHDGRGDIEQHYPFRKPSETLTALRSCLDNDIHLGELEELRLKPWWPWWAGLPHTNFHASLAPDLLHQCHQGLFKSHILPWAYYGMKEAPANWRFQAMSKAEGMRYFNRKVSKIKQWTGRESKELMKQFLPVVAHSACDPDFVEMVRGALDFMYYAHSPELSEDDLEEMDHSLRTFHRLKEVVVKMKRFQNMGRFDGIPKLHMLSHYAELTRRLGAPDGYNSESPEHLHIVYAKTPYRASNKRRPTNQMVKFVERQDALRIHKAYLRYLFGPPEEEDDIDTHKPVEVEEEYEEEEEEEYEGSEDEYEDEDEDEPEGEQHVQGEVKGMETEDVEGRVEDQEHENEQMENEQGVMDQSTYYPSPAVAIAKTPTKSKVPIRELIGSYGADDLIPALSQYLISRCHVPQDQVLLSVHDALPVWHRLSLSHSSLSFAPLEPRKRDVVRARPAQPTLPEAFDTVLIKHTSAKFGLHRYRAARVRAILGAPAQFPQLSSHRLVYLELFAPFPSSSSPFHRMYSTGRQLRSNGKRHCIVAPISDIVMSCHLAPNFRTLEPTTQLPTSIDPLSLARRFWFNPYYNYYMFRLCEYWRRARAWQ
ncbi:hypothetical protein FRC12_017690 [Ceratobasidium sp. 428]|nr:hypothetical protein FRC12_017690 [Ceratobasidium sp. 428]